MLVLFMIGLSMLNVSSMQIVPEMDLGSSNSSESIVQVDPRNDHVLNIEAEIDIHNESSQLARFALSAVFRGAPTPVTVFNAVRRKIEESQASPEPQHQDSVRCLRRSASASLNLNNESPADRAESMEAINQLVLNATIDTLHEVQESLHRQEMRAESRWTKKKAGVVAGVLTLTGTVVAASVGAAVNLYIASICQ